MQIKAITSHQELQRLVSQSERSFLLIYKGGSAQSDCALERLSRLATELEGPLYTADVNDVKDIHGPLGVDSAPSLVMFRHGQAGNVVKGCLTEASYTALLKGRSLGAAPEEGKGKSRRVTVYTTPTCTWCTTLKTYLDQHAVRYQEVNVASDSKAAEAMVQKSGQQGVPQTEINGQMIVGFDKARINQLLELA